MDKNKRNLGSYFEKSPETSGNFLLCRVFQLGKVSAFRISMFVLESEHEKSFLIQKEHILRTRKLDFLGAHTRKH